MKKKKKKVSIKSFNRIFTILAILIIYLIVLKIFGGVGSKIINKDNTVVLYNNYEYVNKDEIYIDIVDEVYFSINDIRNMFDKYISYNETNKQLVSTYNMHVLEMKLDERQVIVNGTTMEIQGALKEIFGKIYLPVTELGIVYDYDFSYSKENKTIMIDSQKNERKVTTILDDISIVKEPKNFSQKVGKVSKDTVVTVLDEIGNYKKVRTDSGLIGYVKAKKTSETETSRESFVEEKKELNVLWDYTDISKITKNIQTKEGALNVIIPKMISLSEAEKNKVKVTIRDKNKEKLKFAAEQNIQIIPYITDNDIENLKDMIDDYDKRKVLIDEIVLDCIKNNLGGVTLNLTKVNSENIQYFQRFILELKPRLKEFGKKLIINKNSLYTQEIYEIADYTIEK